MLQDFQTNDVEEHQETEEIYSIMNKRIYYCKGLKENPEPLGPPDICYLVKETQNKSFLGFGTKKNVKIGCYHYIYGIDTSNIAYISAYISKYIQKLNLTNCKISQSIFCVFDYFLEKDLRILIKLPGGVRKVFFIDDQQAIEAANEDLRTAFLSSVLRSWNAHETNSFSLYLEEINNSSTYNYLVESISLLLKENAEYKYPNLKNKIQFLLDNFIKYMIRTRRFNQAIICFSKLAKYVIKALKYLQLYDDALNYVASMLNNNLSPILLNLEVDLLLTMKKIDDAYEIAKFVSSLNPEKPETWITLSEVYLKKKNYESCIKALNNIYYLRDAHLGQIKPNKTPSEILFKEIPMPKNKTIGLTIKFTDILFPPSHVDLLFGSNQFYMCENADMLYETVSKIMNCPFNEFDAYQIKVYYILLDLIKEINFDAFIDLKKKVFNFNYTANNGISQETSRSSTFRSEGLQSAYAENKIQIDSQIEIVFNTLIEDLKIFSIVIAQDEMYFNTLFNKDDLTITEIKFCIAIGILSERLKYYNTALKFYTKALRFTFSKYVHIRRIKIFSKLKDYKNAIINLFQFLSYIGSEQYKLINKVPAWIDKIILKVLANYQINEIVSWISDSNKYIIDLLLKKLIPKYKYWLEEGHDIHLIK